MGNNQKPDKCTEEHLEFLDNLRESGKTNMFGAVPYLQRAFKLERETASVIWAYWTETFSERPKKRENNED